MPAGEYERFRQHLDAQLRADVELIHEAYRAKLRAYETVARARGEDFTPLPAAEIPAALRPAPAPATPAPAPAPAVAAPSPKGRPNELEERILAALDTVPERFDKFDLIKALGFTPRRSTLLRVLKLLVEDEVLQVDTEAGGRYPTLYRKAAAGREGAFQGDRDAS